MPVRDAVPDFNDGRPIWSTGVYREIVPFERIVVTDSFADEDEHFFYLNLSIISYIDNFADENGNVVPASTTECRTTSRWRCS